MADKQVYPKIPEKNWWTIRNQFKKTLPSVVSPSYLKSLLNLTSDKAASNLLPSLKRLGIIDEDNKPTARANDWRSDAKYKETCQAMIKEVYPQELLDLFPTADIDRKSIRDWFMHTAALGEGSADVYSYMYILLREEIPKDDDEIAKITKPSIKKSERNNNGKKDSKNGTIKVSKADLTEKSSDDIINVQQPKVIQVKEERDIATSLHIDLQIHISPDANSEQIESIFANIAKYLYKK